MNKNENILNALNELEKENFKTTKEDNAEVRHDIEFLYNCFRKCALGDDTVDSIDMNIINSIVEKYGFKINEDLYLKDMVCQHNETCYTPDQGYTDEVGGYHDGGVGWNPNNVYCGECNLINCKGCVNEYVKNI